MGCEIRRSVDFRQGSPGSFTREGDQLEVCPVCGLPGVRRPGDHELGVQWVHLVQRSEQPGGTICLMVNACALPIDQLL